MDYFSHKTLRYTDKTVKMIKTDTKEVIPVIERAISARLRTTPRATSAVQTRQHSRLHSSPHFPRSHEVAYRNPQDSQASLQILVKKKKIGSRRSLQFPLSPKLEPLATAPTRPRNLRRYCAWAKCSWFICVQPTKVTTSTQTAASGKHTSKAKRVFDPAHHPRQFLHQFWHAFHHCTSLEPSSLTLQFILPN